MKKIEIIVLIFFLMIAGLLTFVAPIDWHRVLKPRAIRFSNYTCKSCGSTKYTNQKYILKYVPLTSKERIKYKSPGFSSCHHNWRGGIGKGIKKPIADGNVILVRKDGKYGAFILHKQMNTPEGAEFEWWGQSDGSGNLDTSSKTVSAGQGNISNAIIFLDFKISWSINTKGFGWLYYTHEPGESASQKAMRFCITNLISLKGIDAADPKWKYKSSITD